MDDSGQMQSRGPLTGGLLFRPLGLTVKKDGSLVLGGGGRRALPAMLQVVAILVRNQNKFSFIFVVYLYEKSIPGDISRRRVVVN